MTRDTSIGGPDPRFPDTRPTVVRALVDGDGTLRRQSQELLVTAYWKPVYKHVRLRWRESNEGAKDLTQAFFSKVLEGGTLSGYDPGKGTFRTYLRVCVDGFLLNERKRAGRLKRAGDAQSVPLDFDVPSPQLIEEAFQREWARSVFTLALEDLRGRADPRFPVFERYDLTEAAERPTYEQLGSEFGIGAATVTNYLAAMRRELRKAVLAKLRELTATEREFRSEARAVLGIEL